METLHGVMQTQCLENPDAVRKWGDVSDWHHAIGTGPFILKDFVPNCSATLIKNPNYWGYDERYPQNKLPYVDMIKYLIIPDQAKALSALRAGEIDIITGVPPLQAQAIRKTNPEILHIRHPGTQALTLQPRNDKAPFNNIKVRRAMQMAIDLPTIAKDYYHGLVEPYPSTVTSRSLKGWGFPYEEWPQDLRDEYTYSPTEAKKLLAEAGYPHGFKTNVAADITWDIDLLRVIKSYFAEVGIDMEIWPMEPDALRSFVGDRKHELVYRQYGPFGHTYSPLQAIIRLHSRREKDLLIVSDPVIDAFYPKAMAATSEDELRQIVRDMNERVARQHFAISLLQPIEYSLCQPWLKGYHGQIHSIWMGMGGPSRLSLYAARFWIDQNKKKTSGVRRTKELEVNRPSY